MGREQVMKKPLVGIVMGSTSDWEVMQHAARQLKDFGVAFEARALSAHRTPDALIEWVETMAKGGAQCFIAGAGGAAHLAGVVAATTTLPVLGGALLALHDAVLAKKLHAFRARQAAAVKASRLPELS